MEASDLYHLPPFYRRGKIPRCEFGTEVCGPKRVDTVVKREISYPYRKSNTGSLSFSAKMSIPMLSWKLHLSYNTSYFRVIIERAITFCFLDG